MASFEDGSFEVEKGSGKGGATGLGVNQACSSSATYQTMEWDWSSIQRKILSLNFIASKRNKIEKLSICLKMSEREHNNMRKVFIRM